VCESAHLVARGMIVTLPHPKAGALRVLGVPVRLHATPGKAATPPPLLGQHSERVLRGVLGLTRAQIGKLRTAGVV
jgi:crotonobetainyl-CoA:carnitine CoA-transferase CaiB-like acyl-CoA transferase